MLMLILIIMAIVSLSRFNPWAYPIVVMINFIDLYVYIFISGRINEVLIEKVNMCGYADARINLMDIKKKCYKILNDFIN
jgi:hypothetical protein